jgi:phosphatidylglycerol:prolipoprotein diacylglycerol transferase
MNYIGFPGLHLEFNINPVAFSIFGKSIYWYGIIITCGFLICLYLASRDDNLHDIKYDDLIDFIILCVPISIIGARIYYVLGRYDYYIANPSEIIKIWNGGIAIYGAIISGVITGYMYCRYKKIRFLSLMDYCVPYLVLGQGIGRWGNFVNAEAYGYTTNLP